LRFVLLILFVLFVLLFVLYNDFERIRTTIKQQPSVILSAAILWAILSVILLSAAILWAILSVILSAAIPFVIQHQFLF